MPKDDDLLPKIEGAALTCVQLFENGKKILLPRNGGSAADAQHMAGDFVNQFVFDQKGLPASALTADSSVLTAMGNDLAHENLFSTQQESSGTECNILIAYSTSGKSKNILLDLGVARNRGLKCIGFNG